MNGDASTQPDPLPPRPAPPPPAPATGAVPESVRGVFYNRGLVILLMIVTLGIFGFFWTYRTNEDLKRYNGDGLGGVVGVIILLIFGIILMFTIPNEIKNAYERDGRQSPVSAAWGLWFLLPIIGQLVWYLRVQGSLNDLWVLKGAKT